MSWLAMRYPGGKPKALTLSYDDGVEPDKTLVAKMTAHGIRGTFNLNSGRFPSSGSPAPSPEQRAHSVMPLKDAQSLYLGSGMEVAVHGVTHPFLEQLPLSMAAYEVLEDRRQLERWFQTPVQGMAYPFGTYSDQVVEMLKTAGIHYARTCNVHHSFAQPTDWLRLPATCHHNDPKLLELAKIFVEQEPNTAAYQLEPWLFYLWGHSYEFEDNQNWQVIDQFFETVAGKPDIWYATNGEIYDYTTAYRRLEFSVEGHLVRNPSAMSVWIYCAGKTIQIPSGAELSL